MSNENQNSGVGFWGLLALALIILKLCKVIDWSWWWVTFPLWGGLAIGLVLLLILIIISLVREYRGRNN